jgi:uncharacterized membrane protein
MADENKSPTPETDEPTYVVEAAIGDETGTKAAAAIAIRGDSALLVAEFADMDAAKATYESLRQAESKEGFDIEGVLVVKADEEGKIHVQKMTDHTTRTGFKWGAVAGVVVGVIFPPSILASAATLGAAGAIAGKVGNQLNKGDVARELAGALAPGSSGIIAVARLTDIDKVKQQMPAATKVTEVPVTGETAEAIKEAAAETATPAGSASS